MSWENHLSGLSLGMALGKKQQDPLWCLKIGPLAARPINNFVSSRNADIVHLPNQPLPLLGNPHHTDGAQCSETDLSQHHRQKPVKGFSLPTIPCQVQLHALSRSCHTTQRLPEAPSVQGEA